MHYQTSIPDWPTALLKMPDYSLVKSVNDPSLLVQAMAKWSEAGRDPSRLWTDFRHHDLFYPNFDGLNKYTWDDMVTIWRLNFRRFIDATYLRDYAPHVRLVEELNEYTDTRMITDKALLAPRLLSAQAACWVWNNEYRGRTIVVDGVEGHIPADCRLVICNSPVGNDVPKEYYRLSVDEDAPLGVHPYTKWNDRQRDPGDFRWHSGRWHYNEQEYGIKPDYVFTESAPYNGSTDGGWRHSSCMGGDVDLLLQGMVAWWNDVKATPAYQEGRILGPGAWFTSGTGDDQWDYYRLWTAELSQLADRAAAVWNVPTEPPPPPPPPPPEPGVPYIVVVNLLPQDATFDEKVIVLARVHDKKQTILQSADDAARLVAPGRVGSKVVVWDAERFPPGLKDWLMERGVGIVEFTRFETEWPS